MHRRMLAGLIILTFTLSLDLSASNLSGCTENECFAVQNLYERNRNRVRAKRKDNQSRGGESSPVYFNPQVLESDDSECCPECDDSCLECEDSCSAELIY